MMRDEAEIEAATFKRFPPFSASVMRFDKVTPVSLGREAGLMVTGGDIKGWAIFNTIPAWEWYYAQWQERQKGRSANEGEEAS